MVILGQLGIPRDILCTRSISYTPIIRKKGVQSSLDMSKKQKFAQIWRPISTESDDSAGALVETLTSGAGDYKSEPEPVEAVKSTNLDYSHFISLPLGIHPELVEKLQNFQKSVLDEVNMIPGDMDGSSAMGIDRSIFPKPQTLHLTVLMLKLWNKDRVATAAKILKEISLKVMDALENRPVSVRLSGLACMKGSPAKAQVVYAPIEEVDGDGRLLRACQVIIDAYVEAGLVLQKDARQSLKLHATLMNVRHRKRNMRTKRVDSFDARGIFKKYGKEDWGEYVIPEAHLSQRFRYDESGYYHCCCSIPLPVASKFSGF